MIHPHMDAVSQTRSGSASGFRESQATDRRLAKLVRHADRDVLIVHHSGRSRSRGEQHLRHAVLQEVRGRRLAEAHLLVGHVAARLSVALRDVDARVAEHLRAVLVGRQVDADANREHDEHGREHHPGVPSRKLAKGIDGVERGGYDSTSVVAFVQALAGGVLLATPSQLRRVRRAYNKRSVFNPDVGCVELALFFYKPAVQGTSHLSTTTGRGGVGSRPSGLRPLQLPCGANSPNLVHRCFG
jgi:hypothetical protein